jgi:predicted transcriptional regulator
MQPTTLGDQELALLRFVSEQGPTTAGEAAAQYGEPNGLARSTVETVLTRLFKKGYLARIQAEGVYRYQATMEPQEVMGGLVEQFVEKTLGGSLVPFVNYFVKQNQLSESELSELQQLVSKLEARKQGKEQ